MNTPFPDTARRTWASGAALCAVAALLAGCAANPLVNLDAGDKGVFFKRISLGCVAGRSKPVELKDVELDPDELFTGEVVTHRVSIERCIKDDAPATDTSIKVIRQIVVGSDVVATSTEDVSAQIDRNGIWEVNSQINVGKNPPGRYQVRTTLDVAGKRQVIVEAFTLKK